MWQEERHQRIKAMVATFQRVTNERLAEALGVSRETVRRDLVMLEAEGALKRVHGGAISADDGAEAPFAERAAVRLQEKRAIARLAARMVRPGQTIFLDAGSTTAVLADELATLSGLSIVTNSIDVAAKISAKAGTTERANTIVLIGGRFGHDPQATYGAVAVSEINRYRADLALLSPVGVDPRYGATSFDPAEAEVARAMVANAKMVCILADHSKWGVPSRVSYCPPDRIGCLIGDDKVRQSGAFEALRDKVGTIVTE